MLKESTVWDLKTMWLTFYIFVFEVYYINEYCAVKEAFSGQICFRNTRLNQVKQIVRFVGYLDSLLRAVGSKSWGRGECKLYSSNFISYQTLLADHPSSDWCSGVY